MQYVTLGRTGIQVSRLCFGTMSFGGDADEQTSAQMFARCREIGINFFDCANVYAQGRSEQILGKLIADCRDEIVLTTKVCMPTGSDVNQRGLSRRHIFEQVDISLKRLGTDHLDLYFLHHFDAKTPIEVTLVALDDLVRQGKILHPAVSNWSAWQIAKALGISQMQGLARFECVQPMYNLLKRQAEVEILPLAQSEQLAVINYSPAAGGLLSGKYGVARKPPSGRILESDMYKSRYGQSDYFEIADRFTAHANSLAVHPVTLAVAWSMVHPAVTSVIIGARNLEQLEPSLAAIDLELSAEQYDAVTALSPAPSPATDRSEE